MSTASSVGMIVSGIILGVFVGVGGIYMDVIPNPQAQILELRLEDSGEEIDELAGEAIDLQLELSQKSSQLLSLESNIGELEGEIVENEALLNQAEVERDTLIEEISQKELELVSQLEQITDLGEQLSVQGDRANQLDGENQILQQSNEALQVQLDSLNTVIEERADLLNEVSELNQQIISLINQRNTLQLQTNSLSAQLASLQFDYDELKVKWDLWKSHSESAPQARPLFDWIGFFSSAGNYQIDEASFLISFPDPNNCFIGFVASGSGSMRPAIGAGHQLIETTCYERSDLRVGDIITYQPPAGGITITHQIIEIRSDGVITKGIHNEVSDPFFIELEGGIVRWDDIVGLVVAIIY